MWRCVNATRVSLGKCWTEWNTLWAKVAEKNRKHIFGTPHIISVSLTVLKIINWKWCLHWVCDILGTYFCGVICKKKSPPPISKDHINGPQIFQQKMFSVCFYMYVKTMCFLKTYWHWMNINVYEVLYTLTQSSFIHIHITSYGWNFPTLNGGFVVSIDRE
jgi:hypothetical protein